MKLGMDYQVKDTSISVNYERVQATRDLCINMNNHQNAIFHQFENFLKTPLALLGVDLKN